MYEASIEGKQNLRQKHQMVQYTSTLSGRQSVANVVCNSSLCNQFWKTEAAETGVYSRILRVFQNLLSPHVINICILMRYQCGGA